MCGLIEGDAPVHFTWKKNGESLATTDNVNIMTHGDFSRLVINNVDVESSGNYTCIAKNSQGQDMHSAHLAVRGKYYDFIDFIFVNVFFQIMLQNIYHQVL